MLGEVRDGVVGADVRGGPDRDGRGAETREARPAPLLELVPGHPLEIARVLEQRLGDLVVIGGTEVALSGEVLVDVVESALVSVAVVEGHDAPFPRPLLDGLRQERADLPVRLRLLVGLGDLPPRVGEGRVSVDPLDLRALVPGGHREDVIGVHGGRGHPRVERHDGACWYNRPKI